MHLNTTAMTTKFAPTLKRAARALFAGIALGVMLLGLSNQGYAQTNYWDGPNVTANGVVDGGTATWNATSTNWTQASGTPNGPWPSGRTAVFQGTAGIVTLAPGYAPNVSGLDFTAIDGHTITGGAGINGTAATNTISCATSLSSNTISSSLLGANKYQFINQSTNYCDFNLTVEQAFTGDIEFQGGTAGGVTVLLTGNGDLGNGNFPGKISQLAPAGNLGTSLFFRGKSQVLSGNISAAGTVLNIFFENNSQNTINNTVSVTGATTFYVADSATTGTTLYFNGSAASTTAFEVGSTGTLGGTGTVNNLTVRTFTDAVLSPGGTEGTAAGVGTLSVTGALTHGGTAVFELGQANVVGGGGLLNDKIVVSGNLSLDAASILNVKKSLGGSLGLGTYRLITYTGTRSGTFGTLNLPAGYTGTLSYPAGAVDLTITVVPAVYWDGPNTLANSTVDGGTSTWDATTTNWTTSTGTPNSNWQDSAVGIFQGTAGTVTVSGTRSIGGLTFNTTNYIIGNAANNGTLTGAVASTVLTTGAGISATINSVLGGTNAFAKQGAGGITLAGTNTYTGTTTVTGGNLVVNGSTAAGSAVTVQTGAILGGAGTVNGTVSMQSGSTLSPGSTITVGAASIGTLSTGALTLNAGSTTDFELGVASTPSALNDLVSVTGNLTLGGTLNVTQSTGGNFTAGTYRLFNVTGTISGTLAVGTLPAGYSGTITTAAGQVNLVVVALNFWDGGNLTANSVVNGGAGTWAAATTNWTSSTGTPNGPWPGASTVANFQGTAGTVTVSGTQSIGGLTFGTTGYIIGNVVNNGVVSGAATSNVLTAGAGISATVNSVLSGTNGFDKQGAGTISLAGTNTFTGTTTFTAGPLSVATIGNGGVAGNLGQASNAATNLVFAGGTLQYSGATASTNRAFTLNAGSSGTIIVSTAATTLTMPGATGSATTGAFTKAGTGILALSGINTYTGATTISAGTLQISGAGSLGSGTYVGAMTDNATLLYSSSANQTLSGNITGTGVLTKDTSATSTLTLSGTNSYSGVTTVSAGTVLVNGNQSTATGSVTVASTATLGGTGTVGGSTTVQSGGTLRPGAGGAGTLSFSSALTLNASSVSAFELGAAITPSALNDLVVVTGNLTMGGTLNVTQSAGGNFVAGTYRLFNVTGTISGTLAVGTLPAGYSGYISTNTATTPKQVNLVVVSTANVSYWDGAQTIANSTVNGGTATWDATTTNWTDSTGNVNASWPGASAVPVFQGTAGTVTVNGTQSIGGITFNTSGYIIGNVAENGTLSGAVASNVLTAGAGISATINSVLAGANAFDKQGTGSIALAGTNTYTGTTSVTAGALLVNGSTVAGTAVTVATGGTLGGAGTVNGTVSVQSGGTLSPGSTTAVSAASIGTLSTGALTLNASSVSAFELGAAITPSALNDLVVVTGNLTLGGTLNVTQSTGGNFVAGTYRLFNVTGTISGTLAVGTLPAGYSGYISTNTATTPKQVNLVVVGTANVSYWDGAQTIANSTVDGGTSTWAAATTNWTDSAGGVNAPWPGGSAVAQFQGTAGTVTVSGTQSIGGLTFGTTGYTLTGAGTLSAELASTPISVGTGLQATLSAGPALAGTDYTKEGAGTLVLNDINTFTGSLTVNQGTLWIQRAEALGAGNAAYVSSGATLFVDGGITVPAANAISIAGNGVGVNGALHSGTNNPLGNTWNGPVTLTAAARIGVDNSQFTLGGQISTAGFALTLNPANANNTMTINGVITGAGAVTKTGLGLTTLSAVNTYNGSTIVSAGTLSVTGSTASGSTVSVSSGATLAGTGTVGGATTVQAGATLSPGVSAAGVLSLSNGLALNGAAVFDLGAPGALANGASDLVQITGSLNFSASSSLSFNTLAGYSTTGEYVLFTYTGTRTGTIPAGNVTLPAGYQGVLIYDDVNRQVRLGSLPSLHITAVSNGGTGTFTYALSGLDTSSLSLTTTAQGTPGVTSTKLVGTIGAAATITQASPALWPANPSGVSCVDANGTADGNGTGNLGTLAGSKLSLAAGSMVAGSDITCTFTNGLNSLSGKVFSDNGAPAAGTNTGTPNNGLQDGNEAGISAITVSLTDCSATTYATTTTDGSGLYNLSIPAAQQGSSVCVKASLPGGAVATGANASGTVTVNATPVTVGGVSYTYTRSTQQTSFLAPAGGAVVLNFGQAGTSALVDNSSKNSASGSFAAHPHSFTAGSGGSLTLSTGSATANPAISGWSSTLYTDPGCTGGVQSAATPITAPVVLVQGQQFCFVLRQDTPSGAASGNNNTVPVQASFVYTNASPALSASYSVSDVTTINGTIIDLKKSVRNVTTAGSWGTSNSAKSGDVLEYQLSYTNKSPTPISNLAIQDSTSTYTTFVGSGAGTLGSGLSACSLTTPAATGQNCTSSFGGKGNVVFTFTGSLSPSGTGSVTYQVTVD
jgi:fibronectin-binding autotransporter adhesin